MPQQKPVKPPTPREIAVRARAIRRAWDAATRRARRVGRSLAVEVPSYTMRLINGETVFEPTEPPDDAR